ncbi:MAG: hypothetical protein RLZZ414_1957 [Bacteroidota bacterium]|jgi:hypothetical protein
MYSLTIQDQISLDNGKFNITESWFTISFFIIFPICVIILYFILKTKYAKDLN